MSAPTFCGHVEHRFDAACPDTRCSWPTGGAPFGPPCGRRARAVYVLPDGQRFPRCRRHDTIAARAYAYSHHAIREEIAP